MEYNEMQRLKREMFARRNGVVADALRKGGSKFSIIFGMNLPQLAEVAGMFPQDKEFANKVWQNNTTRESMLIAPMLMPREEFSKEDAKTWLKQAPENEVIDVLCLKLLRHQPYALQLAQELIDSGENLYAGLRLMCNLAPQYPDLAVKIGQSITDPRYRQLTTILTSYQD